MRQNADLFRTKILNIPIYVPCVHMELACPSFPPLGIATIASYLRQRGVDVEQDDLNIKVHHDNACSGEKVNLKPFLNERRVMNYLKTGKDIDIEKQITVIARKTNLEGFNLILFAVNRSFNPASMMIALALARYLKENHKVPIGAGGCYPTTLLDLFKKAVTFKLIDFLVAGPGEIPSYELINALRNKTSLHEVPGLVFLENNKIIKNKEAPYEKLSRPDFEGLPLDHYRWNPAKGASTVKASSMKSSILVLPYRFIQGCPYNCAFCISSADSTLVVKPPSEIVDDLQKLSERYKTRYFYFLNDTVNVSNRFINELCDEIIKRKLDIYWNDCANIKNLDKETLYKMRRAGCIRLIFGLETASPRLLKYIEKGISPEQASKVLRWCQEIGIWTGLEIICGFPKETEKDNDLTIGFLNKNKQFIDSIYVHRFYLVKGSKMWKYPEKYGIKNIRETKGPKVGWRFQMDYEFDEIDGLKWGDKIKQIMYFCNKTTYACGIDENKLHYEQILLLFKLYSIFSDKVKIKDAYMKIVRKTYRRFLLSNPSFLVAKIMEVQNFTEFRRKLHSLLIPECS